MRVPGRAQWHALGPRLPKLLPRLRDSELPEAVGKSREGAVRSRVSFDPRARCGGQILQPQRMDRRTLLAGEDRRVGRWGALVVGVLGEVAHGRVSPDGARSGVVGPGSLLRVVKGAQPHACPAHWVPDLRRKLGSYRNAGGQR